MLVIKKDGTKADYDEQKIINAVNKAASRALYHFTPEDYSLICNSVLEDIEEENFDENDNGEVEVPVIFIHGAVEHALLEHYPTVGQCYQQYRNYKLDFVKMMDDVYSKSQSIRYLGDLSNANSDASMISTQRSLIYGELNKALYEKFFATVEELQAMRDGYIYVHDEKDRLDGVNCCLFNIANVMTNGFEMGNLWYNEPKTLDVAFDVISDIVLSAASQEYGGFTVPRVDTILSKYAEKSYKFYFDEYVSIESDTRKADEYAMKKVERDFEQGFQSWEMRWNSVGSSRGDYSFISISFGIDTSKFGLMASETCLKVRKNGQGKKGFKKPVLFPKLTFLYDENLHGEGKPYEYLFDLAIECSKKTMYPDYLSLTGEGYIPSIYKKYGKVISLMG